MKALTGMQRRTFTSLLLATPWAVQAQTDALALRLQAGACAVMLRHAKTEPGIGDPPGFMLDRCSTQRNLSPAGRAQAAGIGDWFKRHGQRPGAVQSSAWCRCKDTANLAFGSHVVWPALNSFFGDYSAGDAQTAQLRSALETIPAGRFEVWVTHQVNMIALTGASMAMGEALVVDAAGKVIARSPFA